MILKYPHEALRYVCKEVDSIDKTVREKAKKLEDSLSEFDNPLYFTNGLAANQIGLKERIVIFKKPCKGYLTMINPEIVSSYFPFLSLEMCASLPWTFRLKKRDLVIRVKYQDLEQKYHEINLWWLTSFTMQQEIDHLNGKLIID